jgi:hypothetical protein
VSAPRKSKVSAVCVIAVAVLFGIPAFAGAVQAHNQQLWWQVGWASHCNPWNAAGTQRYAGVIIAQNALDGSYVLMMNVFASHNGGPVNYHVDQFFEENGAVWPLGDGSDQGTVNGNNFGVWDTVTVHTNVAFFLGYDAAISGAWSCVSWQSRVYKF